MSPTARNIPWCSLIIALLGVGVFGAEAAAQEMAVRIRTARVGLPSGRADSEDSICKFGCWAPVYVELEVLREVNQPTELVVETPDARDLMTRLAVPINLVGLATGTRLQAGGIGSTPYVRPATGEGPTTITVRLPNGTPLSAPFRLPAFTLKDPSTYVVLSVPSRLPAFQLPEPTGSVASQGLGRRGGRVELATIATVDDLPDHWFGYQAVDLLVLTTGSQSTDFLKRLFAGEGLERAKRQALVEWVRRGGRLVVSIGETAPSLAPLPGFRELLPWDLHPTTPNRQVDKLLLYWNRDGTPFSGRLAHPASPLAAANLIPKTDRPGRVLIPVPNSPAEDQTPIAVQAAVGLGRVTVIGFDLDRQAFAEFDQKADFYDWLLGEAGAARGSVGSHGQVKGRAPAPDEDDLAVSLRSHLDTFEAVPVVSFGWLAVLIGLYILIICPLEYYLLKRLLGRLELTWITFPIIAGGVCTIAFLAADSLKGRDLRINKVDIVDIDVASGRVFGSTWFTVFSPRIDVYTVGLSPGEGWTAGSGDPLMSWSGSRSARANPGQREYRYHVDGMTIADGLMDVPVPVWSTKSFTANWSAPLPSGSAFESRLVHPPGDPAAAIGSFLSRLPVEELRDCVVFYAGQAYPILPDGVVLKDERVQVVMDKGIPAAKYLQEEGKLPAVLARAGVMAGRGIPPTLTPSSGGEITAGTLPLWGVLFHEAALRNDEGVYPRNTSLRSLDQSWRLVPENRDEVIFVGRVPVATGATAGSVAGLGSPSRLWLRGLPTPGNMPPDLPGFGRQETYLRVYLPVRSPKTGH